MALFPKIERSGRGDDLWSEENIPESTPMRDYYRDKVVFLTGGTGFLGQIYVEKLLR